MPKNEPEYGCLECSRGMAQEKSAMKIPQQTTRTGGYTSNLSGGKKTFFFFSKHQFSSVAATSTCPLRCKLLSAGTLLSLPQKSNHNYHDNSLIPS